MKPGEIRGREQPAAGGEFAESIKTMELDRRNAELAELNLAPGTTIAIIRAANGAEPARTECDWRVLRPSENDPDHVVVARPNDLDPTIIITKTLPVQELLDSQPRLPDRTVIESPQLPVKDGFEPWKVANKKGCNKVILVSVNPKDPNNSEFRGMTPAELHVMLNPSKDAEHKEVESPSRFNVGLESVTKRKAVSRRPYTVDGETRFKTLYSAEGNINEDTSLTNEEVGLFAVFDGMGGHAAGEVASSMAADAINAHYTSPAYRAESLAGPLSVESEIAHLTTAFAEAHKAVVAYNVEHGHVKYAAATAAVVKFLEGPGNERKALIAGCGDSRVYMRTADGKIIQLSVDNVHLLDSGDKIAEAKSRQETENELTEDNQETEEYFDNRNVVRFAVGLDRQNFIPLITLVDLPPGASLIIVSDGVSDNLTTTEMEDVTRASTSAADTSLRLRVGSEQRAYVIGNDRSKGDDITALAVEPKEGGQSI